MRIHRLLLGPPLLLLFAALSFAQTITLPTELKVTVGRSTPVVITSTGKATTYDVLGDADCFREYDPDGTKIRLRVTLYSDSVAWVIVASADDKGNVAIAKCKVTSAAPVPPPIPPGPNPPTPPVPPGPGPFDEAQVFGAAPKALRVLILFDDAAKNAMPAGQQSVLYSQAMRTWLNGKCDLGPDGKTHEWRIWEKGQDPAGDDAGWAKALKGANKTAKSYPWLVCQGPGGWYNGPLPADVTATQALLSKYAPKSELKKAG